jgi:penicillin amidase
MTLVGLALIGTVALAYLVRHNLPDDETPRIPCLEAPVSVSFDDRGVALVKAASVLDALRMQGYLTARERLFQMDIQRRVAAGEAAELFGHAALESDRLHRTYGFSRVAAAAVPLLPAEERAHAEALAAGINAFLETHRGRLGLEFDFLRREPRPFTPADSLLVLLKMYEDLSSTWETEIALERLARLPGGLGRFLVPRVTQDDVTLVPDARPVEIPPLPDLTGVRLAAVDLPGIGEPFLSLKEGLGSNNWAVSGALTKSGKPMLANDPHLGLNMPSIWLPMRFEIAGHRVEGVTLPGLPGVILGRNGGVAWAFTNLGQDIEDLYREAIAGGKAARREGTEDVRTRVETIAVRGEAPDRWEVRETSHGPLVTKSLALRWVALDPRNLHLPNALVMLAEDPEAMVRLFDGFAGPGQNVVWASASGHIGWRASGLVPLRRPGTDGSVPYDGRDPENDWRGYVPLAEMPRIVDPPSGYIVTANQRVVGNSFPHVVATDWPWPGRARRIRDLLEAKRKAGEKLDREGFERIQMDVVSDGHRELLRGFLPFLPGDWEAMFRDWDGAADAARPQFLIATTLRRKLRELALRAWRVRGWQRDFDPDRAAALLRAEGDAWARLRLGDKRAFVEGCVKDAREEIERRWGREEAAWSWGNVNRLAVRHPLGRVPGLSWLFDPPSAPQSGFSSVVKASRPAYGQSMRFIMDWGDPEAATLVVPFGVSGHVRSPHRTDQFEYWLNGDPGGKATRLARPVRTNLVFTP